LTDFATPNHRDRYPTQHRSRRAPFGFPQCQDFRWRPLLGQERARSLRAQPTGKVVVTERNRPRIKKLLRQMLDARSQWTRARQNHLARRGSANATRWVPIFGKRNLG